jgi:E3 ubiquitin-protein ligase DOA10
LVKPIWSFVDLSLAALSIVASSLSLSLSLSLSFTIYLQLGKILRVVKRYMVTHLVVSEGWSGEWVWRFGFFI